MTVDTYKHVNELMDDAFLSRAATVFVPPLTFWGRVRLWWSGLCL